MNVSEQTLLKKVGKAVARPLSRLFAHPKTAQLSLMADAYLCILLGKGAGSGWSLDAEIKAASRAVHHPAPIVFDVGANTGEWTFLMRQNCPQAARFFLFEPQPVCQKAIERRKLPNSMLIPHAVSSSAGEIIELFVSKEASELASLHQRRDSYFDELDFSVIGVKTVTIDGVVEEHGIDRIDLLKMDVEGHELSVLEGAMQTLKHGRIRALTFEFGSSNINSRTFFHDFWDFLTPLGFQVFRILPSGRLMPIRDYYEDCEYFRGATNYIAILQ